MVELTATAPAKINYTLTILGRRPDGYHNLRSIMQTVSLYDHLVAWRGEGPRGIHLTVDGPTAAGVPVDGSNLVVRAALRVLEHFKIDPQEERIGMRLTKEIPSRAGLGGGSSDAAAAILLVLELLNQTITTDVLLAIGASLGADIPFFLTCGTTRGTALVEGLGERITKIDVDLSRIHAAKLVIVKPDADIDTAAAYAALDAERLAAQGPAPSPYEEGRGGIPDSVPLPLLILGEGWGEVSSDATDRWLGAVSRGVQPTLHNDFEPVIRRLNPAVDACLTALASISADEGGGSPLLAGSGAAVFVEAPDTLCAAQIFSRLQAAGYRNAWIAAPVEG